MNLNYVYRAKIVKVYQGINFNILIDLGFGVFVLKEAKLFGVSQEQIEDEDYAFLFELLKNKEVFIKVHKNKKNDLYEVEVLGKFKDNAVINLYSYLTSLNLIKKI
jgi:hypothetical protein